MDKLPPNTRVRVKDGIYKDRVGTVDTRQAGVYRVQFSTGHFASFHRGDLARQPSHKAPS